MSTNIEIPPCPPKSAGSDVILTIALAILINAALYRLSPAYAGPLTAVAILITTSVLVRIRGHSWGDLGLGKRHRLFTMLGLALLVMVVTVLAGGLTAALCAAVMEPTSKAGVSRFGDVQGDLMKFLGLVTMGWIVGGFAEEMVFRGFFLHRFEALFAPLARRRWVPTGLAVIAQAALFGAVHFYNRGLAGGLTITVVGISFGAFYLFARRSLWPGILAHGMVDSLGFLEDYLGV